MGGSVFTVEHLLEYGTEHRLGQVLALCRPRDALWYFGVAKLQRVAGFAACEPPRQRGYLAAMGLSVDNEQQCCSDSGPACCDMRQHRHPCRHMGYIADNQHTHPADYKAVSATRCLPWRAGESGVCTHGYGRLLCLRGECRPGVAAAADVHLVGSISGTRRRHMPDGMQYAGGSNCQSVVCLAFLDAGRPHRSRHPQYSISPCRD